ncbi:hypothetical protein D3C85_1831570 [compost metagenome]
MPAAGLAHLEDQIEIILVAVIERAGRQSQGGNPGVGQGPDRIEWLSIEPHEFRHRVANVVGALVRFGMQCKCHISTIKY